MSLLMDQLLNDQISRRSFLKSVGAAGFVTSVGAYLPLPAWAKESAANSETSLPKNLYNLNLSKSSISINGKTAPATTINGTVPGPLIRLKEGERVRLNVTNELMDTEHASIHWHGLLVPFRMDGVPGVNFNGIKPGETYEYEFDLKQNGTYWYHSHSAFQEQTGIYGPLIIEPKEKDLIKADREYVIVLSDWSFEDPETIFRNLHKVEAYYNFQQRTFPELIKEAKKKGWSKALSQWLAWDKMRMSPVDILDVTGATYTYLVNGKAPEDNWTGLFNPGEKIRLRIINASAMTNFDIRIPGLDMTLAMVDGKPVKPVDFHEFRIGVAETYDVLVAPKKDKAYTLFCEAQDRSGYARATLAPEPGLEAEVPDLRPRPVRDMAKLGMAHGDMDHDKMKKSHAGHSPSVPGPKGPTPFKPDKDDIAEVMVSEMPQDRLSEPGLGLGDDGWKVLTYSELRNAGEQPYSPDVDREMTINITANMERYMFSFDGKKFSEQPGPYLFKHQERLRLYLVNHTMMDHPIHLHGMWMQLENGASHDEIPFKHTVLVKPGEKLSLLITPIEKGDWAFHCHLLYHMEAGMMQVVRVK